MKKESLNKMKYQTLIFDLDGTLLNTIEDLADSLNFALSKYNLKTYTVEEVKYLVGSGIKVMVERALKDNMSYFEVVFNTFKAHYSTNNQNKTRLYDGVYETIETLSKMNIKMAIVSNKYQQGVIDICQPLLGKYIDVMVGEQPGLNKKPSSDMVMYALNKLDASTSTCAYVGDSDVDFQTAKNANLDFIGCAYGFRGRKFLEDIKAKYVIDNFNEIINIIK